MDLTICSLSSGSSGNCVLVSSGLTNILIDVGISGKKVIEGMNALDSDPEKIDAILVTHEHIDHIRGLGVMLRKYGMQVYATRGTITEFLHGRNRIGEVDPGLINAIVPGKCFMVGDIIVDSFRVSHDAADPVAYTFSCGGKKVAMATDLGFYDDDIVKNLKGAEALYLEANHDVNMLEAGPYPFLLKQRIKSDLGHLSNETCGKLVTRLCNDNTVRINDVILAHLSEENNFPELAYETVKSILYMEVPEDRRPALHVAPRFEPSFVAKVTI